MIFLFRLVVRLFPASVCDDVVLVKIGRTAETVLWEAPVRYNVGGKLWEKEKEECHE